MVYSGQYNDGIVFSEDRDSYSRTDIHINNLSHAIPFSQSDLAVAKADIITEMLGKMSEHEMIDFIHSNFFDSFNDIAGSALFSKFVHKYPIVNGKADFGEVSAEVLESAKKVWEMIPLSIRGASSTELTQTLDPYVGLWFVALSGLFPCEVVYERLARYPTDAKKIIDSIACANESCADGSCSDNLSTNPVTDDQSIDNTGGIRERLREVIQKKENESNKFFSNNFEDFLNNGIIVKKNIVDFPELMDYANNLIEKMLDKDGQSWFGGEAMSSHEAIKAELKQLPLYLIDSERFVKALGDNIDMLSFTSPSDAKGFFITGDRFLGTAVVVYLEKNVLGKNASILEMIGLKESDDLAFSQSITLWHEVAHFIMDKIIQTSHYDNKMEDSDEWMAKPSEIAAMMYGNIPYIRNQFYNYFLSLNPFPEKITQGLLYKMKVDLINTFPMEFGRLSKEDALHYLDDNYNEFNEEQLDHLNSMSHENKVNKLTYMFTDYFFRIHMLDSIEDEIQNKINETGESREGLTFREEKIVPETYEFRAPGQKDKFITSIQNDIDYIEFIKQCQQRLDNDRQRMTPDQYLNQHRNHVMKMQREQLTIPSTIEGLMILMYELPATISGVDLNSRNHSFGNLASESLRNKIKDWVEKERKIRSVPYTHKPTPITPQEGEESAKFMVDMYEDYGPDWIWTAKTNNWYKRSSLRRK